MTPKAARTKGKNFEREIAKDIERRLGGRAWRTPCSGALWWNKTDVTTRDNIMGRFHIEAKRQERFRLDDWYSQALSAAAPGRIPLVIAKRNRDVPMVYMKYDDFMAVIELWQAAEEAKERETIEV